MQRLRQCATLVTVAVLAVCLPLSASTVLQMNLGQMCDRADKIFRGTVLGVKEGTVQAGGGAIPTVTYRLRVDESFKGSYQVVKGMQIAEITMVGKPKATPQTSALRAIPVMPELPKLQVGRDYLLLTTQASAIGLSTTVGLGQGAFQLSGKPGQELAVNGNHNSGLLAGMGSSAVAKTAVIPETGPIPYAELAQLIRGIVGQ